MSNEQVNLAIRPVQEFISQARRARDFWAGSYLLSFLAGKTLAALPLDQVVLPQLHDDALMQGIWHSRKPLHAGSRVGSIPHVAELRVPPNQAAAAAERAAAGFQDAWKRVTSSAWKHASMHMPNCTEETVAIWKRQTDQLWSIMWTVGEASTMARRKSLRDFAMDDEPGEKCTCCGAREPLRGADPSRTGVMDFWRAAAPHFGFLEIRPDGRERLCAICLIKRILPDIAEHALGWRVPTAMPSTTALASFRWRLEILRAGVESPNLRDTVRLFCEEIGSTGSPRITLHAFPDLVAAARSWPEVDRHAAHAFIEADGDWFFPELVMSSEVARELAASHRDAALQHRVGAALGTLRAAARDAGIAPPSTYYALLAMDGDKMGELLRENADQKQKVSSALSAFGTQVPGIVEGLDANGWLLYAGGDDVLAFLPLDRALATAERLRHAYTDAFATHLPTAAATISAGLVYAHMRAPLRSVVRAAHELLDNDAKEGAGRDALAVAVWKRPGIMLRFAKKWNSDVAQTLQSLQTAIARQEYSRSFLHSLRHLLHAMPELDATQLRAVLAAQYIKNRQQMVTRQEAEERVAVLQRLWPDVGDKIAPVLLAAFLAKPWED